MRNILRVRFQFLVTFTSELCKWIWLLWRRYWSQLNHVACIDEHWFIADWTDAECVKQCDKSARSRSAFLKIYIRLFCSVYVLPMSLSFLLFWKNRLQSMTSRNTEVYRYRDISVTVLLLGIYLYRASLSRRLFPLAAIEVIDRRRCLYSFTYLNTTVLCTSSEWV